MAKTCQVSKIVVKDGKETVVCDETRSELLPILQAIQTRKGYIPDKDMQEVADQLGIHPVEVYSVVTFYSFLTTEKKGKNIIRISNCVSCEMAGAAKIVEEFERCLKISVGETTKDKLFTLELTPCIGMCDQSPAIMVNDDLLGNVTVENVKKIIRELKK